MICTWKPKPITRLLMLTNNKSLYIHYTSFHNFISFNNMSADCPNYISHLVTFLNHFHIVTHDLTAKIKGKCSDLDQEFPKDKKTMLLTAIGENYNSQLQQEEKIEKAIRRKGISEIQKRRRRKRKTEQDRTGVNRKELKRNEIFDKERRKKQK